MSYSSIPDAWREVGKAVKKDLVDRIHDNLEDLNNRSTNLEGSISTQIIANQAIKKERDHAPIGSMVWSPLSEAQFQSATDDGGWELCDGASAVGSDYGTLMSRSVLPDVRGVFLRMADGSAGRNPDGNVATDTFALYDVQSHAHNMNHGHGHTITATGTFANSAHTHTFSHRHDISHAHQWGHKTASPSEPMYSLDTLSASATSISGSDQIAINQATGNFLGGANSYYDAYLNAASSFYTTGVLAGPSGSGASALSGLNSASTTSAPSGTASVSTTGSVSDVIANTDVSGGPETRPSNVTENLFIKVNKNYITVRNGYLLWRAPQALTINQVVLAPVTQGTSGTLTIDIKKGPLGSISTSIFDTLPDMLYSDATAQTGVLNATNSQLDAGDYVRLDITTTQAKLQEFHILIAATPA